MIIQCGNSIYRAKCHVELLSENAMTGKVSHLPCVGASVAAAVSSATCHLSSFKQVSDPGEQVESPQLPGLWGLLLLPAGDGAVPPPPSAGLELT